GAGPKGLASMRSIRPLGEGELLRPLLDYSRDALREYAREKQLQWVEDPSNQQLDAARNYIRHEILPRLRQRWPAVTTTLSRSAAHCGEADRLIEQWGRDQLSGLRVGDPLPLLENESDEERKARIRCWLSMNRIEPPNHRHLHAILDEVVVAREDATPELVWVDQHGVRVQLSRYRQALYLREKADSRLLTSEARWNMEQPLPLTTRTELRAQPSLGCGLRAESVREGRVTVNWRSGGERCQPVGAKMRRTVKNLLREVGVPPWQRAEIPLLFIDGVLAQVVGYFVCAPYAVKVGEWGVSVEVVERQL
ncbi:MAG: tRNA lysidine(34) synthetase TilS, partial [Gammaproteobacteria bacterium]|nr:tRNA lysidine(34) synthetase TilS [Gammaproteobacteria bacterium]